MQSVFRKVLSALGNEETLIMLCIVSSAKEEFVSSHHAQGFQGVFVFGRVALPSFLLLERMQGESEVGGKPFIM